MGTTMKKIFAFYFNWRNKVRSELNNKFFSNGYSYAAGKLLEAYSDNASQSAAVHRVNEMINDLIARVDYSRDMGDYDAFDGGIEKACEDFNVVIGELNKGKVQRC